MVPWQIFRIATKFLAFVGPMTQGFLGGLSWVFMVSFNTNSMVFFPNIQMDSVCVSWTKCRFYHASFIFAVWLGFFCPFFALVPNMSLTECVMLQCFRPWQ